MEEIKKKIRDWWNSSPCCSKAAQLPPGTKEFYKQVDLYKDTYEPFTDGIADYSHWKDKYVLEIGCGLGKDFSRFAANGAKATGIDISDKSLALTVKRLEIFGLKGNFCVADAENLPFKDNVFNLIFSWGVLHHTPNTQKAIDEIRRCLGTKGSKAIVMLYNKHSLVYLYFLFFSRAHNLLRKIKKLLLFRQWFKQSKTIPFPWECVCNKERLAAYTDGVGNPLSKVYSRGEALNMFSKFRNINICTYEPKGSYFVKIFNFFKISEKYLGWFMVITAEK